MQTCCYCSGSGAAGAGADTILVQRWCSKVVQRRWCRCRDAGAEVGGRTEHRCVDVQTEMQRCEVHRHGGEEVQRWCSKVVKMFSGAE